jgi:hypothetical protein
MNCDGACYLQTDTVADTGSLTLRTCNRNRVRATVAGEKEKGKRKGVKKEKGSKAILLVSVAI